jgi:predicted nucleic acid-binding protein
MRLFLDANVLFSAAHRDTGSVRIFFRLAAAGTRELVSSPYAIDEARRNVARKYPERLVDLEALVGRLAICVEATPDNTAWAATYRLPVKDAPILAAAVQAGATLLVTGDQKDFGHLYGQTLRGTQVLPPVAAIEWVIAGKRKTPG